MILMAIHLESKLLLGSPQEASRVQSFQKWNTDQNQYKYSTKKEPSLAEINAHDILQQCWDLFLSSKNQSYGTEIHSQFSIGFLLTSNICYSLL